MLYSTIFSTATLLFASLACAAPNASPADINPTIGSIIGSPTIGGVAIDIDVEVLDLDRRTIVVPNVLSAPQIIGDLKAKSAAILPQLRTYQYHPHTEKQDPDQVSNCSQFRVDS